MDLKNTLGIYFHIIDWSFNFSCKMTSINFCVVQQIEIYFYMKKTTLHFYSYFCNIIVQRIFVHNEILHFILSITLTIVY